MNVTSSRHLAYTKALGLIKQQVSARELKTCGQDIRQCLLSEVPGANTGYCCHGNKVHTG